jgi:hypothetical protein
MQSVVHAGMNRDVLFPDPLHPFDERGLHNAQPCIYHACLSQPVKQLSFRRAPPNKIEPNRPITKIKGWRSKKRSRCSWAEYDAHH